MCMTLARQFIKLTTQCQLVLIVWFKEFFDLQARDESPFGCSSHKNQALSTLLCDMWKL